MYLRLKNPLAFFDLETTGTNIVEDRLIEAHFIKVKPNGDIQEKNIRVNPGIPIPPESSIFHGIYDEDVSKFPLFKSVAKELAVFLEGTDLAGFSIFSLDLPILAEEFIRAEVDFDLKKRKFIDAQRIFHLMEKRNLTAAYKFYCNKELHDAHSAKADTKATLEILNAQIEKYEGENVEDNKGDKIGEFKNNVDALHQITSSKLVDFARRMILDEEGIEKFNFGKHKGKSVQEVLKKEPVYYDWIMKGKFTLDTKRKLTEIRMRSFNE